ncbi:hypothetical protein [Streptomyces sp. DSS69]|uniref:hypothetical protein n=1 Tax=Streptomyces sp. DSS69 TaxID=3113369 RepID=UPI0031F8F86D
MQFLHAGEGVDDAVIAVAQQMGETVRQFGVVHQDEIRAGGAVQVDQVRPQGDPDPVGAQNRQSAGRCGLQGSMDGMLLFFPRRSGNLGSRSQGPQDVVPQKPVAGGDGGMDHDAPGRWIVRGHGGLGEQHVVTVVKDHRAGWAALGSQSVRLREQGAYSAAHQDIDASLAEWIDRIHEADGPHHLSCRSTPSADLVVGSGWRPGRELPDRAAVWRFSAERVFRAPSERVLELVMLLNGACLGGILLCLGDQFG